MLAVAEYQSLVAMTLEYNLVSLANLGGGVGGGAWGGELSECH